MDVLSPRQREVLDLVAKGLTNEDVARVLQISPGTARVHVASVLARLCVANRTEATAAFFEWKASEAQINKVLTQPAIAVLPFTSLTQTPRGALLAAAVTQDLTTLFARWCWFPVIPISSSGAAYTPGEPASVIGLKVGARFIVEGSLRAAGQSWRLSVRVDDAEDGRCLWAERFDFPASDVFEVQDAVCEQVVATAYDVLIHRLSAHVTAPQHPEGLDAWTHAHQGMLLHKSRAPLSNTLALDHFTVALTRDAHLVLAHFGMGLCHYNDLLNQWNSAAAADALFASAQRCIELAPHAAEGYFLLGRHFQARGLHAQAIKPLEMAIARNPSAATAHALLSQLLGMTGAYDVAKARMQHALRLCPHSFVAGRATLHFVCSEYQEALDHADQVLTLNPRYAFARVIAMTCAWWLGDRDRARAHLNALLTHQPSFSITKFLATFGDEHPWVERIALALRALNAQR
jgi:adenylate cyclase